MSYADDFVNLSRGKAAEALGWARGTLTRLGLTLNEAKTSIRNARQERFDFLGYTFGPHFSRRTGREYVGYSPSQKSVNRIKEKVGEHLKPGNVAPVSYTHLDVYKRQVVEGSEAAFRTACAKFGGPCGHRRHGP